MTAMALGAADFDPPPLRASRLLLGVTAALATLAALWGFLRLAGDQPIERLQVEGRFARVSAADIERIARPLVAESFGRVDLQALHAAVAAVPWVGRVRVEREWPATVRLRVWEREPVARWGAARLLDADGTEFAPDGHTVSPPLPLLEGPPGSAGALLHSFRQLSARLDATPFALAGLRQDARGDWSGVTTGGIALHFGRGDPAATLDTLLGPAARALAQHLAEVEHVDLRYTNGFSVSWRKPAAAKQKD